MVYEIGNPCGVGKLRKGTLLVSLGVVVNVVKAFQYAYFHGCTLLGLYFGGVENVDTVCIIDYGDYHCLGSGELKELLHAAGSYSEDLRTAYLILLDCVIEYLTRYHLPVSGECQELKGQISRAGNQVTEEAYRGRLEAFLDQSVEKLGKVQTGEQRRYLENARKYMEEHYDDSMLSLALVGESGSGKSVTAYSIMRILADTGRIVSGSEFGGGIGMNLSVSIPVPSTT